ncbi:MAG: hypothetical protein ACPGPD_09710 [Pseudomonadales bacterium]
MQWTRMDLAAVALASLISVFVIAYRSWLHYEYETAANQVTANVLAVAASVHDFHENTGRWFPMATGRKDRVQAYPDPFHPDARPYQGLDVERLRRENNSGLVLQLVRHQPRKDRAFPLHLFEVPYQQDEPYLRVLLDYGGRGQVETEIMMRVQEQLPDGILGEVDDHYYVVDLRKLIDGF